MTPNDDYRPPALARAAGALLVACGLVVPAVLGIMHPASVVNDTTALMFVLGAIGMAASRIALRFSHDDDAPVFDPSSGPIVVATVICSPVQAMLVVLMADLLDFRAIRASGWRTAVETAGISACTAGVTAAVIHSVPFDLAVPSHIVVAALVASTLFLLVDGLIYTVWYHLESRSAGVVLSFLKTAGPVDLSVTLGAAVFALPFGTSAVLVAAALSIYQGGVYVISRIAASESIHREQSAYLVDAFSRYVPRSVAEQLASRDAGINLGGETREVTVVFCDIRGFTAWAEQTDAETVIAQLNDVLGNMADAVLNHEGTLDKYTGDGLMAFWGSPLEQPDHARMACEAAMDLVKSVERSNAARRAAGQRPFEVGVGIATGQVVVGNVGHEKRLEYTVIGDTVNLAARLEAATSELDMPVVIDMATALELVGNDAHAVVDLGAITLKGKQEPVQVFGLMDPAALDEIGEDLGNDSGAATA